MEAVTGDADREKVRVALSSLLAAVLLTGSKLGVGLWTNSLGILAEAAHSGLDLVAAGMTLWAVRAAGRPADPEHTYGHGKIENLSALFETLLLLITCAWIVSEAVHRLLAPGTAKVDANGWAFGVVLLSIVVDISRSRVLARAAAKHHSQALEADALHFSTDVWSSSVVLLGLVALVVAERVDLPWLVHADSVAALGVALIVIVVSFRLGRRAVNELVDAVPPELAERIRAAAWVDGVLAVTRVRVRRSGPRYFADVTVTTDGSSALERTHALADRVEEEVLHAVSPADVVVHVEPAPDGTDGVLATVRRAAARNDLGAHAIRIYQSQEATVLELHVEVSEALTLVEAHRHVTEFEDQVREALPHLGRVITHLEPAGDSTAIRSAEPVPVERILKVIDDLQRSGRLPLPVHNVHVLRDGETLSVSFHTTAHPEIPISEAHRLSELIEQELSSELPGPVRVTIHVEPSREAIESSAHDARE